MIELMIEMADVRVGDLIQMQAGHREWLLIEQIDPITGDALKIRRMVGRIPRGKKTGQLGHRFLIEGTWRVRRPNP